jgi:hypothetical protein
MVYHVLNDCEVKAFLAAKVVRDGGLINPRALGELSSRGAFEVKRAKNLQPSLDQPLFSIQPRFRSETIIHVNQSNHLFI